MIAEFYRECLRFWHEKGDPRSRDFLFLRTPLPILVTVVVYVLICKIVLPVFFRNKRYPWARYVLVATYVIQLLNCIGAITIGGAFIYLLNYNLRCEPITPSFEGLHYQFAQIIYLWLCIKNLEMVESFLVFLLYGVVPSFIFIHHILLPLFLTVFVHFYIGGSPVIFGVIHSVDHGFNYIFIALRMYSDDYRVKSELWFKKYQFLSSVISMFVTIIFFFQLEKREDCDYEIFKYIAIATATIFIILTVFFRSANLFQNRRQKEEDDENGNKYALTGSYFDPT